MTKKGKRPGDAADIIGVTTPTLRNYSIQFADYLSEGTQSRTLKRYTDDDILILHYAKSQLDDGFTYEQVRDQLQDRPLIGEVLEDDWQPEPEPEPDPDLGSEPDRQLQTLEYIKIIVDSTTATIQAKDDQIEYLKAEIERLRKPWYKRLFGG